MRSDSRRRAAADAIGSVATGESVIVDSRGEFSLRDALDHVLEVEPVGALDLSTWTISTDGVRWIEDCLDVGAVSTMRFVVCYGLYSIYAERWAGLIRILGHERIRAVNTHVKCAIVGDLVLRTSANLSHNPRSELYEVTRSVELAAFMRSSFDGIFRDVPAGTIQSANHFPTVTSTVVMPLIRAGQINTPNVPETSHVVSR